MKSTLTGQTSGKTRQIFLSLKHNYSCVMEKLGGFMLATIGIIPKFRNTEEALRFGQEHRGDQEMIEALRVSRKANLIAIRLLNLMGKEDQAFYLASGQSQLVREALEEATK